mgnify:CR=1 FL=1|jgi:hypothetical protein
MTHRPLFFTLTLLLALLMGSCSDRLGLDNDVADGDLVRFAPTVSEMNDQRPTPATNAMAAKRVVRLSRPEGTPQLYLHIEPALEMGGSRRRADGTRAIYTTDNTISKLYFSIFRENDDPAKPFVDKGLTTKDDNWITTTEWPHGSDQKFKVYSISPFEPSFTTPTIGSVANTDKVSYATAPVLSYTMPDSASQADIVYAVSEALDPNVSHVITMNYRHLFSGIALAEGSMISGLKVKRVDIKGLYAKGSCDLKDLTWTVDQTVKKDFSLEKDYKAEGRYNTLITPSDRAELMVIPQTVPDGATVTVTTELTNGQERKLTASLAGTKLERGVVYWLILSTHAINWRYTLNVSQSSFDTPYNGGTAALTVNSWRTTANSDGSTTTQEAVPFKVEYSVDNGTTWTDKKPDWLTNAPAYVDGAMSSETNITTSGQTAVTHSHAANLQGKTAVTDYDLSRYDINGKDLGAPCTANCYVIHGPGTYRIPCVYGNTLKLGTYNGYAVDYLNESKEGKAFVNYNGDRITESNYKFTPASAAVLWQSTNGVITNAAVTTGSDGMSYITFTVNKTNLQQGNAVIAARNSSGTVMWSWHLWITDATLTAPNNDFLTQNLGWVSNSDSYNHYPARSVQLRITQTNPLSDAGSVVLTVNQIEADVDSNPAAGSGLYYQWGRKDPFRGSDITEDNSALGTRSGQIPLYLSIQYPTTPLLYYYSNSDRYDWTSDHYNVLWNSRYSTQQTNTPVEKSVFDPSPYGFRVPRGKKTYEDMYSSLPNMGYYQLDRTYNWGYIIAVSKQSDKYYWTTRANKSADASGWKGYIVSSSGYNEKEHCSSLLPVRPYKDAESGGELQTSN